MTILFEFFSGIGGMHLAFKETNFYKNARDISVIPFDVNTNANEVYKLNFGIDPNIKTLESLTFNEYKRICNKHSYNIKNTSQHNSNSIKYPPNPIIWLLSPPCQPFTSQGLQKGLNDERSNALKNLITNILGQGEYLPDYIFLENVKNFEISEACKILKDVLLKNNYQFLQFLISPHQVGIPNRRSRYYMLAKLAKNDNKLFSERDPNYIIETPDILSDNNIFTTPTILEYLNIDTKIDYEINKEYYFNNEMIKRLTGIPHISFLNSRNTNCFTRSYCKKYKGSGSILAMSEMDQNGSDNEEIKRFLLDCNSNSCSNYDMSKALRFFTPTELLRFFNFPQDFKFPLGYSKRYKYKLIGNSVNIKVVSLLLKYLLKFK